jgi:hypothetical protein
MKYQKTQKGNKHELTIDQHVFPKRSLQRFASADGRLSVRKPPDAANELRLKPKNPLFCAKRVWDHGAEGGFMRHIESQFQTVADGIVAATNPSLADEQHILATDFYALWRVRAHLRANRIPDKRLHGIIKKEAQHSADELEYLEKNNIGYINNDLTLPGRWAASAHIGMFIGNYRKQHPNLRWGVVTSIKAEFIVPDQFGEYTVIPVMPKVCLIANVKDMEVTEQSVRKINATALEVAKDYIIAQSFAACPI